MVWPALRTRRKDRDEETDRMRMGRILDVLATEMKAIAAERKGLDDRYSQVADDAVFCLEALDNGDTWLTSRFDTLAADMARCTDRLAGLDRQAALLSEIRESLLSFMSAPQEPVKRRA